MVKPKVLPLTDTFTDLADHGEPKSDAEKVQKLLSAICDPNLKTAKATVMATAHLLGDYNEALNFFKGQLDLMSLDGGPSRHNRGSGCIGGHGCSQGCGDKVLRTRLWWQGRKR